MDGDERIQKILVLLGVFFSPFGKVKGFSTENPNLNPSASDGMPSARAPLSESKKQKKKKTALGCEEEQKHIEGGNERTKLI